MLARSSFVAAASASLPELISSSCAASAAACAANIFATGSGLGKTCTVAAGSADSWAFNTRFHLALTGLHGLAAGAIVGLHPAAPLLTVLPSAGLKGATSCCMACCAWHKDYCGRPDPRMSACCLSSKELCERGDLSPLAYGHHGQPACIPPPARHHQLKDHALIVDEQHCNAVQRKRV